MKHLFTILLSFILLAACNNTSNENSETATNIKTFHEVVVKEILQTKSYTYIRVKEANNDYWMAATKMEVKEGDKLFYENAMMMQDFKSRELDRYFETVYFVEQISKNPDHLNPQMQASPQSMPKPKANKAELKISPVEGGVSIAELYKNRDQYANNKVVVRGQVVKVNEGIMGLNWIHIQDGTSNNGNFDLTITSKESAKVGDIINFEGVLVLNKDFGAGYSYEVILEEGVIK